MPGETSRKRYDGVEQRIGHLAVALVLALTVLGARLWQLQIIQGSEYAARAERNRLFFQRLASPRGTIYGPDTRIVLADTRPACDLVLVPAECGDPQVVCSRLATLIGIDRPALLAKIEERKKEREPYAQIVIKQDVSKNELTRVEEMSFALPGVFTIVRPQRRYLHGRTAGQILGYLSEINEEELGARKPRYQMGDMIGKAGLEKVYEELLRGHDGQMLVTRYAVGTPQLRTDPWGKPYVHTDSYGRLLQEEEQYRRNPIPGQEIFTTLDIGLQAKAESLLEGKVGAIAVLDADDGKVLALASTPGYDPSIFATSGMSKARLEVLEDKTEPMKNRAYQDMYPPGSTFKVVLAAAALEEGAIDENSTFFCGGHFDLKGHRWRCWKTGGHGTLSVVDALAFSCDVFFYNVGLRLGPDRIHDWSQRLGLGVKTGLDLPQERTGLIATPVWKKQMNAHLEPSEQEWYQGDTVNLSVGQGYTLVTPLQNAVMIAAVVNDSKRVRPYLNGAATPQVTAPLLSEHTLRILRAGLRKCVEKDQPPSGTGWRAKIPGIAVIGKTGTSQAVNRQYTDKYKNEADIPYALRDHALFVAGVLDRTPRLAISIMVEHGLHGSTGAAPLAKELIAYFYSHPSPTGLLAKQE
ncbi:MAG: penicillin-binding protein 2 [Candidatus Hydrogenedentes bacterium]|nr:penicillin-binding protein 2 [Candidatus Hydrogenedentota bacterium]